MRKSQLLSIIARIRRGATSPQNIFDSLNALATNPPYGGTAITTTLPTVLAQGEQIIYRDPNGVQSLWIGNADGEAWPSVGYKEWSALVTQSEDDAPTAIVLSNTVGVVTLNRNGAGSYSITNASFTIGKTLITIGPNNTAEFFPIDGDFFSIFCISGGGGVDVSTLLNDSQYENDGGTNALLNSRPITIRIYP